MLDHLLSIKNDTDKIETIGFTHSGHKSSPIKADHPAHYITRIKMFNAIYIPNNSTKIGSTVLIEMYSAWFTKESVKRVEDALFNINDENDASGCIWLTEYLEKSPQNYLHSETLDIENSTPKSTKYNDCHSVPVSY